MTKRPRILFVDDEEPVLDGLRDYLRKDRQRWEMVFAVGGVAALAEFARQPFDVVVSDMRMPGMDGAELLGRIKADYPGAARLVLSGHAEREAILRALPVAHQFLSKPCEPHLLRQAIERTSGLAGLLAGDRIRAIAGRMDRLPSVSATFLELQRAVSEPAVAIDRIAEVVQGDPAMSAKVLQLCNSAYFGSARQVNTIKAAVQYLGIELLKGLALSTQVFGAVEAQPVAGLALARLQMHSVLTARAAQLFLSCTPLGEEAFTAGLMHDVGKIVLALGMPEEYAAIVAEAGRGGRPEHEVEREALGVTHAEAGAYLLGVWGLPFSIIESTAFHHRPGEVSDGPSDVLAAVHAADALLHDGGTLDLAFLERAGRTKDLPEWRAIAAGIERLAAA